LLAVGLVAAALSVAAFGLGSSPGGAIHGGAGRGDVVAPKPHVTPQTFVFTKHYDTSSPVLASVRVVIKFPDIDGECVCEPRREPIEILSW
jgi:type VI protein secretion system component Hcp